MNRRASHGPISKNDRHQAFSFMADHVSDYAIFLLDANGRIRTWNTASEAIKGYTADEAIGEHFGILYTDEDRKEGRPQHNLDMAARNGTYQEETWRKRKDGSIFWAMVEIIAIKDPDGTLSGFGKITRDISVRKMLQEQLEAEKERVQVTLNAIGDAVISVDNEGRIDYLNPKAEQLTGWSAAEAAGRSFSEVFHMVDESTLQSQEHRLIAWLRQGDGIAVNIPAVLVRRDGTRYALEDTAALIRLPDGRVTGGVVVFRDVTQSRRLLNTITHQATHDALTGMVNRIEFENRLERSLGRARTSHVAGAVLYMDLDQFKIVNDTCGHDAGDELLRQLASLYRGEIRERDTLARLGGDEFALLADHCSKDEAYSIARKILQSTRDFQFSYANRVFKVGVSIGLVIFDEHSNSVQEILQQADSACYIAKKNGRNQIYCLVVGTSDLLRRKEDIDWASRLTEAMRLNQLELHYQSIANTNGDGSGFHCEVLLRLLDPDRGVILPSAFLPAAERHNLMPAIDRWVVQHVVGWLDAHRERVRQMDLCAVNLSGKTLADETFLSDLANIIEHHDVAADKLCFEVDEAAVIIDMRKSLAMINGLRAMGCKICLAGFGTGMGSFAYLKQLPADFIKIDGSFVAVIADSIVDEKMVKLVHEIAHLTGKKTIAERVENQATAEVLSRIGIDYLQGHWIAYPKHLNGSSHSVH